jgi:hypothetical protein
MPFFGFEREDRFFHDDFRRRRFFPFEIEFFPIEFEEDALNLKEDAADSIKQMI